MLKQFTLRALPALPLILLALTTSGILLERHVRRHKPVISADPVAYYNLDGYSSGDCTDPTAPTCGVALAIPAGASQILGVSYNGTAVAWSIDPTGQDVIVRVPYVGGMFAVSYQ